MTSRNKSRKYSYDDYDDYDDDYDYDDSYEDDRALEEYNRSIEQSRRTVLNDRIDTIQTLVSLGHQRQRATATYDALCDSYMPVGECVELCCAAMESKALREDVVRALEEMGIGVDPKALDSCRAKTMDEWVSSYVLKTTTPPSPRRGPSSPSRFGFSASPPRNSNGTAFFSASPPRSFPHKMSPPSFDLSEPAISSLPQDLPSKKRFTVPNPSYAPPRPALNFNHSRPPVPPRTGSCATISFVGHVDHGKSTLVTSLLSLLTSLSAGVPGRPSKSSNQMDTTPHELSRGVTYSPSIVTLPYLRSSYSFIDNPGHSLFSSALIPSHFACDAACVVVSAKPGEARDFEKSSVRGEIGLLRDLGVRQFVVCVTKVEKREGKSDLKASLQVQGYLEKLGVKDVEVCFVSALEGTNLIESDAEGSKSLMECFSRFLRPPQKGEGKAFRATVSGVIKKDKKFAVSGRVLRGSIATGSTVLNPCTGQRGVLKLEAGVEACYAGDFFGAEVDVEVSEGDVICESVDEANVRRRFIADLKAFAAIIPGRVGWLWMNDLKVRACVISVTDAEGKKMKVLRKGEKGTCKVVTERGILVEKFKGARRMGRFIWGVETVEGVGIVEEIL